MPGRVANVCEVGRLGKRDHVMISLDLMVNRMETKEKCERRNWRKADWERMRRGLDATAWPTNDDGRTAEEAWRYLRKIVEKLTEECVPRSVFRRRKSDWMNGDLLREIRKKRRLWKKFRNG